MAGIANKPLSADDWSAACKHLARKDRVLRRLIPEYAGQLLRRDADGFALLVRSVVWQQLSESAAQQLWKRYLALPGACTAHGLLSTSDEALKAIRLPQRKISYLKDLAQWFAASPKDALSWVGDDDDAVAGALLGLRGIGRWNAEMFLIFHLGRPNVLPLDDAALQAGISTHYFSGDPVSRSDVREVAQAWQPWSSVGAWLIWRSQNAMPMALNTD
ncbi:DNA-3-methyladenine glycosylase 2 family protein [Comamonas testosteroni]